MLIVPDDPYLWSHSLGSILIVPNDLIFGHVLYKHINGIIDPSDQDDADATP